MPLPPSTMASTLSISTALLLIIFINTVLVSAVPEPEYYAMLSALRFRGYHLFANAITTTDLHYDILSGSDFTFFAPIDSALYSLDMSMSAADYTMALRFHGVPHRLSLPELRMLPYGSHVASNSTRDHAHEDEAAPTNLTNLTKVHTPPSPMTAPSPQPPSNSNINNTVAVPVAAMPPPSSSIAASPVLVPQTSIVPSPSISTEIQGISLPGAPPHRPPEVYSTSTTHGREEHMSTATRYELISEKIPGVSLATKLTANATEEFTQVDDKNIDCPFTDDDGELLNIANIRLGDLYARELYTPTNMTCVHE
ncbi:hypothetical protein L2E82_01759 [Cichorium intybus]|uniref:Uncharacterized protein n=1 Tax=Cichorium intybus TaxID=13427 RepID=A0ACB9H0F0_CICIN|nr:hypothetical protein L2E82_01759 [Cichorium intybus]